MDLDRTLFARLVFEPVSRLYAGDVGRAQRRLAALEREAPAARDARRLAALRGLLDHARAHVPHWRNQGLPPGGELRGLADVAGLPFTEKASLQAQPAAHVSSAALGRLVAKVTSGSTGSPVTIWKTRPAMALELAATWRAYGWAGVSIGDRQARFWGVPLDPRSRRRARLIDLACNRRRVSAFALDPEDMERALAGLRRFRPRWLYGYTSVMCEYAEHLRRRGEPWGVDLACVVPTAELLTPERRRLLEEVFGARVFDEYGCGEVGSIAHECEAGRLHICEENMLVEVVEGGRPCAAGEVGEIVVTELNNLATPLIRYRLGDFGALAGEPCPCGRTLGVLQGVYGRTMDVLVNRHGRRFHGEQVTYLVEEAARRGLDLRQFQCVQEAPDRFRIRIVPGHADPAEVQRYLGSRLREVIDPEGTFAFEIVDAVPRSPSGKMRVIVGLQSRA